MCRHCYCVEQAAITELKYRLLGTKNCRVICKAIGDCERILARRMALKTARPRDLSRLREVFAELPALQQQLKLVYKTAKVQRN